MAMNAATFFLHYKGVKAYLDANPDASTELKDAYAAMAAAFKSSFSSADFKQALTANVTIGSALEESTTSALMALNQDRARRR